MVPTCFIDYVLVVTCMTLLKYYRGNPITGDIQIMPNVRASALVKLSSHFVYIFAR